MLKIENVDTYGWESTIRGMRNPMNSWEKSDSKFWCWYDRPFPHCIGPNDLRLMKSLRHAGSDDRKYLRQIFVTMDVTAPLYWWKEMDQYKVGTVTNSCSTMHKIMDKDFTVEDFSFEKILDKTNRVIITDLVASLNRCRINYLNKKDLEEKRYWWYQLIQLLPSSYNQRRTWSGNYEVLVNIYNARKNHKLEEWHTFCNIVREMPYGKELITGEIE